MPKVDKLFRENALAGHNDAFQGTPEPRQNQGLSCCWGTGERERGLIERRCDLSHCQNCFEALSVAFLPFHPRQKTIMSLLV